MEESNVCEEMEGLVEMFAVGGCGEMEREGVEDATDGVVGWRRRV